MNKKILVKIDCSYQLTKQKYNQRPIIRLGWNKDFLSFSLEFKYLCHFLCTFDPRTRKYEGTIH